MKILNFGSLNIDMVYSVDHFVQAGETLASNGLEKFCGGKGLNQSIALARAGAEVYHAGNIGTDGNILIDALKAEGVNTSFINQTYIPSGHAIIQVDKTGQNCILLYGGANFCVTADFVDRVINNFEKDDILLIQNEINLLSYITEQAVKIGMRIALNPSPFNKTLFELPLKKIKWFILNEIEGKEMTGKKNPDDIIAELHSQFPQSEIVLTLGEKGVIYFNGNNLYCHGVYDVPVVDTTAAGDTYTGYFLAGICKNLSPEKLISIASKASSLAVSRKGASVSIPHIKSVLESKIELKGS